MTDFKRWLLVLLTGFLFATSYAQNKQWMLGTWKGTGNPKKSQFVRTLVIESMSGDYFTGTRSKEANDRTHSKIVTAIAGKISKDTFYIKDGAIIQRKDPPNAKWLDCTHCVPVNSVTVTYDTIFLSSEVVGCEVYCEGKSTYYKLIADLDTTAQHSLIDSFGTAEQKVAFKPFLKPAPSLVSDDPDAKINGDSLKNAAKLEKQRQQRIQDSISVAKQNREKQIQDSISMANSIAKQRQKQIDDSLANAAKLAKKRQQQLEDSINVAKTKRQKEIQDSLTIANNLSKQRQLQISDSIKNAERVAKLRQQQVEDSINTAKVKRQKEVEDSLNIVAKRKQAIGDSLNNAAKFAKQRQQQIDDSLNTVKAKRQKEIQDSVDVANKLAKKRQLQIDDSLQVAAKLAKQRQKQIDDSISIAKAKRQKEIQDSIVTAKKRQQFVDDSLKTVAQIEKIRQQKIQDSLSVVAQKRQQATQDSVATAQKKRQQLEDSLKLVVSKKQILQDTSKLTGEAKKLQDKNKLLVQRDNVLLQTSHIKSPDILIELFDNAQIDGDRVSVYHNNELIINNQMLTHESIIYKVHADANNRTHEFILIAENLGTIPPNTALMRITADGQTYKLSVKTDLKTNAKIVFYYDGN